MRSFGHWTPRYVVDRVREMIYQKRNPDAPWITPQAAKLLSGLLCETDIGLEFGSGRSTLWLAQRVRHLTSVEHNQDWYEQVSQNLNEAHLNNVDQIYASESDRSGQGQFGDYAAVAEKFPDASLDLVFVDGIQRADCTLLSIPKLSFGGVLVIDNVNCYLPSKSRSPGSRSMVDGPAGEKWSQAHDVLKTWRSLWTSSGVWDTALFIKPYRE